MATRGIGFCEQALLRVGVNQNEVEGVQVPVISTVASRDSADDGALERREANVVSGIGMRTNPMIADVAPYRLDRIAETRRAWSRHWA